MSNVRRIQPGYTVTQHDSHYVHEGGLYNNHYYHY